MRHFLIWQTFKPTKVSQNDLLDSIEYLDLVMIVESNFQIDLVDADITDENFGSKGRICLIKRKKNII